MNVQLLAELMKQARDGDYAVYVKASTGEDTGTAGAEMWYFTAPGDRYGYAITQANDHTVVAYELNISLQETVAQSLALTRTLVPNVAITRGNQYDEAFPNGINLFSTEGA